MDGNILSYNYGFQLADVRTFANEGRLINPTVIHHKEGFTLFFDLKRGSELLEKCVLITVKGARPRQFKKAQTYTRVLKSAGINKWEVKRYEEIGFDHLTP